MVTILSNLSKSTFVHNKITNAILEAIALPILSNSILLAKT